MKKNPKRESDQNSNTITRQEAVRLVKLNIGKDLVFVFTKKDGSVRRMLGQYGVEKDLKGVGLSFKPEEKDLLVIYDTENEGYRMVNTRTLQSITVDNVTLKVIHEED